MPYILIFVYITYTVCVSFLCKSNFSTYCQLKTKILKVFKTRCVPFLLNHHIKRKKWYFLIYIIDIFTISLKIVYFGVSKFYADYEKCLIILKK